MATLQRAAGFTVAGLCCVGGAGGYWIQTANGQNISDPGVLGIVLLASIATGVSAAIGVWQPFSKSPASTDDVRNDGRRTRGQIAEGLGDVQATLARHSDLQTRQLELQARHLDELERTNAFLAALQARNDGQGGGAAVVADPQVREQIAAIANSDDPEIREAVDQAVSSQGVGGVERAEEALIAAVRASDLESAARRRELGAMQSLYSVAKAIDTYKEAIRLDPDDFWTRVLLRRLLSAAHRTQEAYEVATACLATFAGESWERSVACNELGDVLIARNDLAGALGRYEEGLKISRDLAASDPTNGERARDVSVSVNKIGDVLRARNDLAGALERYEEALKIRRDFAASNPTNGDRARDVSVSLDRVGDVLIARNDLAGALECYDEGLKIRRDLASRDPTNGERARDVSVSLERVGDVLIARNDLAGALERYEEGLTIRRDLAVSDPTNGERARDVSVSLDRVGDVLIARNDLAGALERYEEGLKISRDLAASDPTNMGLRRDVLVSVAKLAPLRDDAVGAWSEVLNGLIAMRDEGVLVPADKQYIEAARAELEAARAASNS